MPDFFNFFGVSHNSFRNGGLLFKVFGNAGGGGVVHRAPGKFFEQGAHLPQRHLIVHGHVAKGRFGHAQKLSVSRLLHHGNVAAAFDEPYAGGAIVQHAGEHHAHHGRPVGHGGRAEQGIHGGAVVVFARASGDQSIGSFAVFHQQVPVGRGQV